MKKEQLKDTYITEIFKALLTPTGPRAYVPRLSRLANELAVNLTKTSLNRAKQVTKNPVIHWALDEIYNNNTDDYGLSSGAIFRMLSHDDYDELPWLYNEIEDPEVQRQALLFFASKYSDRNYYKQHFARCRAIDIIWDSNVQTPKDYMEIIFDIYLLLITNPNTPVGRGNATHPSISRITADFFSKAMPLIKTEFNKSDESMKKIFDRIKQEINKELQIKGNTYKRAAQYADFAIRLAGHIEDKVAAQSTLKYFTELRNKIDPTTPVAAKTSAATMSLAQTNVSGKPKQKPGQVVGAAKNKGVGRLESATRATVDAINAGIKKLKKKATSADRQVAVDSVKQKLDEFLGQLERTQKQM